MPLSNRHLAVVLLIVAGVATAAAQPKEPQTERRRIDYKYCRFDSTTEALCDQYIPKRTYTVLTTEGFDPRAVPLFLTAKDYSPAAGEGLYKLIYASDGTTASLILLKHKDDGGYDLLQRSLEVGNLPRAHLHFADVNGDGRQDVVASCTGGEPLLEYWTVFELDGERLHALTRRPSGPHDVTATFGVGLAVVDSLGREGRPAIEVWQDDSTNFGQRFVHIVHQYSDSTRSFEPTIIDTTSELPFWCERRRRED